MNEINKDICILPWLSLFIRNDGNIYPCEILAWRSNDYLLGNLETTTLEEAFNHPAIKKLRKTVLFTGTCELSNFHKNSCMYLINHELYSDIYDKMYSDTREDGYFEFNLQALFLKLSNLCNLKCVYCNEHSSSVWEKFKNKNIKKIDPDVYLSKLYPHLNNLKELFFSGGEPILYSYNKTILDYLKQNNKNIQIGIATNLTYNFEKYKSFFDILSEFSNSKVFCSIDVDQEQFEFIRENSDWNLVKYNLGKIKNYKNINVYLNSVISTLSSFYIMDFHKRMILDGLLEWDSIRYICLDSHEHLNIQNMNFSKKKELENYLLLYCDFLKEYEKSNQVRTYINNKFPSEAILKIIEFMNQIPADENFINILSEKVPIDIITNIFPKLL